MSVVDGSTATRVLDLSGEVSVNGERGLLGIAFSPDGTRIYVSFTDAEGDNRVVEYEMGETGPNIETRRDVIEEPHPFNAHHGGSLATGPDGMLYIGWGDGEKPRSDKRNAQSLESLLGKILRIDPRPTGDQAYSIPAGNPFVGRPDREAGSVRVRAAQSLALLLRSRERRCMDRRRRPVHGRGGLPCTRGSARGSEFRLAVPRRNRRTTGHCTGRIGRATAHV